jgi:DNA-binding MarR family transcriptional regulator
MTAQAAPAPPHDVSTCSGEDSETTDPRWAGWVAFLRAHAAVTRRLEAELTAERGLSLAEYDALLQLAIAGERRLRMSELADRVVLSRSGMTRMVDRLAADGLIERRTCPSDARVLWATLTGAGLARLHDAMPVHLRGVEEHFLAVVPPDDQAGLRHGLEAIVSRLRGSDAVRACSSAARFEAGVAVASNPAVSGSPADSAGSAGSAASAVTSAVPAGDGSTLAAPGE